jgi:ribosomal protein L37AE/L43A
MRTRSQAAGECDECDSYTTNRVVNGCLLCDRCVALLPDPLGICHGTATAIRRLDTGEG